jgi:hypothetical protein
MNGERIINLKIAFRKKFLAVAKKPQGRLPFLGATLPFLMPNAIAPGQYCLSYSLTLRQ